jgi:hypothetical protein
MAAYELMLDKCSTAWAPWHVIPADRKWARNAAIAAIVRETLEEMNPQYPKPLGPQELRHQVTAHAEADRSVNDKMQKGYRYALTAPSAAASIPNSAAAHAGADAPLGVFCGKYMTDCRKEFPKSWFTRAKLASRPRLLAQFLRRRRQPAAVGLAQEGLAASRRSARLVSVVLPLSHGPPHAGRRPPPDQALEGIRRHVRQCKRIASRRSVLPPRQRQALLHWAYDSRKI